MFYLNEFRKDKSSFIELLKRKWNEAHDETDVFRYKINNLQERILDNNFLLQLNPERSTNRRTPEFINDIRQAFDDNKFNFTKASDKEVLFSITDEKNITQHRVLVNVSPISRYHSLLCPNISEKLPQVATESSLQLALDIMFISHERELKIGFNSLCALASLNHLHYHLFIEKHVLPVEMVKWIHLKGPLYCLQDYPAPAFCFTVQSSTNQSSEIYKLIEYFLNHSIAHNLLISRKSLDDSVEVYLWPRKSTSGVKQLIAFNVAVLELSGWFPIFCKATFEKLESVECENELKKWSYNNFEDLCSKVMKLY